MSSPRSSTSSSSPPSSLPNGVTTGANNPNQPAVTSTRQPNPVAVPSPHRCHDPNAEVVALRPRTFLAAGICELCGKEFTQEQIRDF
ncbi:BnaC06g44000D [Brassica napus]|uniref:BnaC06g44000D protein n=1 Tax=Brassica napus TaxID=3708 RepID=A0A078JWV5_BRANA|nr:BnaC06g44000D [Brassica napus]